MSFYCALAKNIVYKQKMEKVPSIIRNVKYTGFFIKKGRGNEEPVTVITGESEGWEVVKEVEVAKDAAERYKALHPPKIVKEVKQIKFWKPRRRRTEEEEKNQYSRDDREEIDFREKYGTNEIEEIKE